MPLPPPSRPVDGAALKQAADHLADLLNDLKPYDWGLYAIDLNRWEISSITDGASSARALVMERTDGRWETTEVILPESVEQSLAARLRSIAAELEQLNRR